MELWNNNLKNTQHILKSLYFDILNLIDSYENVVLLSNCNQDKHIADNEKKAQIKTFLQQDKSWS